MRKRLIAAVALITLIAAPIAADAGRWQLFHRWGLAPYSAYSPYSYYFNPYGHNYYTPAYGLTYHGPHRGPGFRSFAPEHNSFSEHGGHRHPTTGHHVTFGNIR